MDRKIHKISNLSTSEANLRQRSRNFVNDKKLQKKKKEEKFKKQKEQRKGKYRSKSISKIDDGTT